MTTSTAAARTITTLTGRDEQLTSVPMSEAELAEWTWATDTFWKPRMAGLAQLRGEALYMADGSHLGLIITNGFDMMAEYWNLEAREYHSVGPVRTRVRIAANYLVDARHAEHRRHEAYSRALAVEWDIRHAWADEQRSKGYWFTYPADMPADLLTAALSAAQGAAAA